MLIGSLGAAAALLLFFFLLKNIIRKGLPADAFRLGGKKPEPERGTNAFPEEKLRELECLRENGFIEEEEFLKRKKDLIERHLGQ